MPDAGETIERLGLTGRSMSDPTRMANILSAEELRRQATERDEDAILRRDTIESGHLALTEGRRGERLDTERARKEAVYTQLDGLITKFDEFQEKDRHRRLSETYGRGWLGRLNAQVSSADIAGGPSVWQEAGDRARKTIFKSGIVPGLVVGSLTALGVISGTAIPIAALGVAGGFLGRAAVETYRLIRGSERAKRHEIEEANGVFLDSMRRYYEDTLSLRQQLVEEHADDPEYNVEEDSEYITRLYNVIEVMYDDSKRAVRRVRVPDPDNPGEFVEEFQLAEAGATGDDILNIGEAQKSLRNEEKGMESIADWVSLATGLASGFAAKFLIGKKLATQAGQVVAQRFLNGEAVGAFDFDKVGGSHMVRIIQEKARYIVGNMGHWIGTSVEGTARGIISETAKAENMKQLIALLATGGAMLSTAIAPKSIESDAAVADDVEIRSRQIASGFNRLFPRAPRTGDNSGDASPQEPNPLAAMQSSEEGEGEGEEGESARGQVSATTPPAEPAAVETQPTVETQFPDVGAIVSLSLNPTFVHETGLDGTEWFNRFSAGNNYFQVYRLEYDGDRQSKLMLLPLDVNPRDGDKLYYPSGYDPRIPSENADPNAEVFDPSKIIKIDIPHFQRGKNNFSVITNKAIGERPAIDEAEKTPEINVGETHDIVITERNDGKIKAAIGDKVYEISSGDFAAGDVAGSKLKIEITDSEKIAEMKLGAKVLERGKKADSNPEIMKRGKIWSKRDDIVGSREVELEKMILNKDYTKGSSEKGKKDKYCSVETKKLTVRDGQQFKIEYVGDPDKAEIIVSRSSEPNVHYRMMVTDFFKYLRPDELDRIGYATAIAWATKRWESVIPDGMIKPYDETKAKTGKALNPFTLESFDKVAVKTFERKKGKIDISMIGPLDGYFSYKLAKDMLDYKDESFIVQDPSDKQEYVVADATGIGADFRLILEGGAEKKLSEIAGWDWEIKPEIAVCKGYTLGAEIEYPRDGRELKGNVLEIKLVENDDKKPMVNLVVQNAEGEVDNLYWDK